MKEWERELKRVRARRARVLETRAIEEREPALLRVAKGNLKSAANKGLNVNFQIAALIKDLHSVWTTQNQAEDAAIKYDRTIAQPVTQQTDQAIKELSKALTALKEANTYLKKWEGFIATAIYHAEKLGG